jgi:hypothetical protein
MESPVIASAKGLDLVAHHDRGGHGDGVQVIRHQDTALPGAMDEART